MANYNLTQTGAEVQAILNRVAAGYIYMGVADLTTTPDTTNPNVCYLLKAVGTYTNLGNIQHASGIGIALWNGSAWSYQSVQDPAIANGLSVSVFDYSQFASAQPNITLSTPLSLSQVGDYIEIDVNPNGTNGQILRKTASYQNPRLFYSAANTINISYALVSPSSFQNSGISWSNRQKIKVVFDSVDGTNNVMKMYVDGTLATTTNVVNTISIFWDMIGWLSTMKLYSIVWKHGNTTDTFTKFSEIQGVTGITDNYTSQSSGGLIQLNEDVAEIREDITELQTHAIGEDMYYSFTKVSSLYNCESHFSVYQKIKANIYAKFNIAKYVTSTQPTWPQNYWRIERGDIVTLINGNETTIQSQAFVAGENEFVLSWTDGTDYNYSSGYTGGFHYGESPQWVEFYADDRLLSTETDIPLTPCKSFFYKEYSDIYQKVAGTIAAHHYKRTDFKEGGYDTLNEVQFTQALGYYAYFGIVCVGRYLSQYAMPENTPTATDMGTGDPSQSQQFKSNNHRIHYEGNGFATDVWSELLYGDDDSANELVVYNSTAYNKYYRRTQNITGSTLNRSGGITKVRIYPLQ